MDQETCAAFVAVSAGAMATLFAGFVLIHAVGNGQKDGRSWRRPKSRRFALRMSSFLKAYEMEEYHEGWFMETLRCTKHSFDSLVALIEEQWEAIHGHFPAHNAVFSVKERVGVCLHYLTHSGSLADSAKIFGMGRSSVWRFVEEVTEILILKIGPKVIRLPQTIDEWDICSLEFQRICGFPDVCLAVDGSLVELLRTLNYEGWYCRKGYPAINIQCVVDANMRFRDYAMRPGSENDKGVFSRSFFGQNIHKFLPPGKCIVADAGYQLFAHCLTPYDIRDEMTADERNYNYLHSRTRIVVECALGRLKGRFRRFQSPLSQRGNKNNGWRPGKKDSHPCQRAARIARSCLIMHNLLIDLKDTYQVVEYPEEPDVNGLEHIAEAVVPGVISGDDAKSVRDAVKDYLYAMKNL